MSTSEQASPNTVGAVIQSRSRRLFVAWYIFIGLLFSALLGNILLIPLAVTPDDWWTAVRAQFSNVIAFATAYPIPASVTGFLLAGVTVLALLTQRKLNSEAAEAERRLQEQAEKARIAHEQDRDERHYDLINRKFEEWTAVKSNTPKTGVVNYLPIPALPGFIERPEVMNAVRADIIGANPFIGLVAFTGLGGVGKTTIARALCDDPAVQARFADGILFISLGPDLSASKLLEKQLEWIRELGGDQGKAASIDGAKVELQRLLRDRNQLLIVDDVWRPADLAAFLVAGPQCGMLVTTRNAANVPNAQLVELNVMTPEESRRLLLSSSKRELSPAETDRIAERLGNLPLMLDMVGTLLQKGISWSDIDKKLEAHALTFFAYPGKASVFSVLATSLDYLGDATLVSRYKELVIFPQKDPLIPQVVARLWRATAQMDEAESLKLFAVFVDASLIQGSRVIHDLQLDYLRAIVTPEEQQALHSVFADSYGPIATWTVALDDDDTSYGWNHAAIHLHQAGRADEVRRLLTDGSYLEAKMRRAGVGAVLSDLALRTDDDTLHALAIAIRAGAVVLGAAPDEIWNQAQGRGGLGKQLHFSQPRPTPRFDLVYPTLLPADPAMVNVFKGHTDSVLCCAYSPDGKLIASGADDKDSTLRLWDVATGETLRVFEGHYGPVPACVFLADGAQLLSAGDSTLRLWDVATGETLRVFEGHTAAVNRCALNRDETRAISVSDDATVRLWDVATGETLHVFEGHSDITLDCAFSPDGQRILSASADGTVRLWDIASGESIHVLRGHTDIVLQCAFSPDGQTALSASFDKTLRLWDVTSGETIRVYTGHEDRVWSCAFSRDGRQFLSASEDATLRLWDVATGAVSQIFTGHTRSVLACAFSPDGLTAISAAEDTTLRCWNVTNTQPATGDTHAMARPTQSHTRAILHCAISPDGTRAVSASADNTLRLWDVASGATIQVFTGHTDRVWGCAFMPDGQYILSASDDKTLRLWNIADGATVREFTGHVNAIHFCAITPDGRQAVSCSLDRTLRLWDLATGATIRVFEGHTSGVETCAISPDGQLVLSASNDKSLRLWEIATGESKQTFWDHDDSVWECFFLPDGQRFLSGSADKTVRLWDIATGEVTRTFAGHTNYIRGCCCDPEMRHVISASEDSTLRLWDITDGRELARWTTDTRLTCCRIAPDGRTVIAGDTVRGLHFLEIAQTP